ncbi:MAG: thrombospondin type 3 repeat-containing protein [Byssovorax sp.]
MSLPAQRSTSHRNLRRLLSWMATSGAAAMLAGCSADDPYAPAASDVVNETAQASTVVLYSNNFETPNVAMQVNCGNSLDSRGINFLYGKAGFTYDQQFTVEGVTIHDPSGKYSDPSGKGGNYSIGMLTSVQDDKLALHFSKQGHNIINVGFDLSSIDVQGCGGPFGVAVPKMKVSLLDTPSGAFNWNAPVLSTQTLTGVAAANQWTFNWTYQVAALDAHLSTNDNITVVFDLVQSGYGTFDNLSITASDQAGIVDMDNDGIADDTDNCPTIANANQADADGDGKGDVCDNCPSASNATQTDSDGDGKGNACDNCVNVSNANQADADSDGVGNVCDNCQNTSNASQVDADGDGIGDACDACVDVDHDGICGPVDNCPNLANANQADADGDGIGDACDACIDVDHDGVCGPVDNCPNTANANQLDADGDGIGDACDACIDVDHDTVCDSVDNCVGVANANQADADGDGIGDACDNCLDMDKDGACDPVDNCPGVSNPSQIDSDGDGAGDACDVACKKVVIDADTYVDSQSPASTHGAADPVYTGGTRRALFHFNLGAIPPNAMVVSGTLTLTEKLMVSAIKNLTVSTSSAAWAEATATWANTGAPTLGALLGSGTSAPAPKFYGHFSVAFDALSAASPLPISDFFNGIVVTADGTTLIRSKEHVDDRPALSLCYLVPG